MTPGDVRTHIFALQNIGDSTDNAEMLETATQLAAHLEFRAVRLWGANWRRMPASEIDGQRPLFTIENLQLPAET